MVSAIFWLVAGLVLILVGANALTDGASAIACRMGISELVVGLSVVAFGTSTPELAISIIAAASGNSALAVGNVVGSNILNILLIIGITALIRPVFIKKSVMTAEIPMLVLSSLILLVLGYSNVLDTMPVATVTRVSGIFLLVFFLLFMRYTFASARSGNAQPDDSASADRSKQKTVSVTRSVIYVVAGLAALIFGGDKFVDGASQLARRLGMSDATIGLTIVAVGTSLPELATSIVAAVKNQPGIVIGNVIGSNIFNILLVLGASAIVAPLPFAGVTLIDLWTLVGASFLFLVCGWFFRRRCITRIEGLVMLVCYIAYTYYLVVR